jgi:hypothetical protein
MLRGAFPAAVVLGCLILAAGLAAAGCEPDLSGPQQMVESTRCLGFFVEGKLPKKASPPRKVAIAAFQVRYALRPPANAPVHLLDYGQSRFPVDAARTNFFELSREDFHRITEVLYDGFVASLAQAGIEAVEVEKVLSARAYQTLQPDSEEMHRDGKFSRGSAYGLKTLKPKPVQYKLDRLARLTKELGVDASVTVFMTVGLLPREGGQEGAFTLTLRGSETSPMEIFLLGGMAEKPIPGGGSDQVPAWMIRMGILRGSRPLAYTETLRPLGEAGPVLDSADFGDDVAGYARGAGALAGIAGDLVLAHWTAATAR